MQTYEVIKNRRSVRRYKKEAIPGETLERIMEAATYAPSAVNLQPWYFVVIQKEEDMQKLGEIMSRVSEEIEPELKSRFVKHPHIVTETTQFIRRLGGAPVCVLAFELKPDYGKTASTIIQSVSAAIQNLLLAAEEEGIGSCWMTAALEVGKSDELRDAFAPGKGDLVAMITLGYPDQEPKAPPRKEGRYIIL